MPRSHVHRVTICAPKTKYFELQSTPIQPITTVKGKQKMSARTQEHTLHKNLRAIAATNVELAKRLCLPVRDDQIHIGEDGQTLYQYGRVPRKLNLSSEELPQPSTLAAHRSDMVIAGVCAPKRGHVTVANCCLVCLI